MYFVCRFQIVSKAASIVLQNATVCAATVPAECGSALYAWHTPVLAFLKTVMMMMGEFDYLATFIATIKDGNQLTMHFTVLTFIVLLVFIFLIPILLMNLLVMETMAIDSVYLSRLFKPILFAVSASVCRYFE